MQTTFNRNDLYRFERLVNKLVKPSELPTTAIFSPCSGGTMFIAFCENATLTLTVPDVSMTDMFSLPWSTMKELGSKKDSVVELGVSDSIIIATWSVNGIPQQKQYLPPKPTDKKLPHLPENNLSHSMQLFDVLDNAGKCTDAASERYALGGICLRGSKAQIVATDGRQAFLHDNFAFPWENDVLCPTSRIFGSREVRDFGETVILGATGDQVCFQVGAVTFWFKQIEGRFPKLDQFTDNIDRLTWLHLDPGDAEFVVKRLDNMPGKMDKESPVFVSLGKEIAVRGHDRQQKSATELRLSHSHYEGKEVMTPVNRTLLKNAIEFGVNRIGFSAAERSPLIGYGESNVMFIMMPLDGDEPMCDAEKLTVLASGAKTASSMPGAQSVSPVERKIDQPESFKHVPTETQPTRTGTDTREQRERVLGNSAVAHPGSSGLPLVNTIQAAEALCTSLYETLQNTRQLVRHLKHQRKQDRLVRNTLESLKQLQGIRV